MKPSSKMVIACLAGVLAGAAGSYLLLDQDAGSMSQDGSGASGSEREPLYWVAPMDPDYRRDGPGKSPMGMDLIPVYEDGADPGQETEGTIRIAPEVVNNLGVRTAPAQLGELPSEISTVGYVQYDEDRLVHIHPRVEGWIEKLHVKASGDPVELGAPLYDLYSPQLVNAQEEYLLTLRRGDPTLMAAAEDRLRALQLSADDIARLKRDRSVRSTVVFSAPQNGVVDNLNIREGFFVTPDTTLMSIGVLDHVWVQAEVFERQAALVAVGQPVTMRLDYLPGRTWEGAVDYIYPTLDEAKRTLRVRLRFDNGDRLLQPNMFAQVVIHADPMEDAVLVPREAVIRTGSEDRVVLALGDGRFRSVPVELGRVGAQHAVILRGIDAGERVVVSAQFLLDSESNKKADLGRLDAGAEDGAEDGANGAQDHSHHHHHHGAEQDAVGVEDD
jgi:Cu(I)/Ag(I) efflux system membrane fusion protein